MNSWGSSASDCSSCINTATGTTHLDAFGLIEPFCYIPTNYQTSVNDLKAGATKQTISNKSPINQLSFTVKAKARREVEQRQSAAISSWVGPISPAVKKCLGKLLFRQ